MTEHNLSTTGMIEDRRIIITLDAGGTNFVFSAIRGNREMFDPITLPSHADHLDKCLANIIGGFEEIISRLGEKPSAISFAFPGPAYYELGIINDLPNLKAFRGGVALGPMLEDHFKLPVYINNDGDLFAYGEALSGFLPDINEKLKLGGSLKTYRNLIGLTLGTGFGCGITTHGQMITGDNSCGAEIYNTLNPVNRDWNAEESVSTRAIQRSYSENAGLPFSSQLMPRDIFAIARGEQTGNVEAAQRSFRDFGEALGGSIANVLTLVDGIVVLGGGLMAAWELFAPEMFRAVNGTYLNGAGEKVPRSTYRVYDLEDPSGFREFSTGRTKEITMPNSRRKITYDDLSRTGIGISKLGASRAISLGACAFALQQLDKKDS